MTLLTNIVLMIGVLLVYLEVTGIRNDLQAERLIRVPGLVVSAVKNHETIVWQSIRLRLWKLIAGLALTVAMAVLMFHLRTP